MTKKKTKSAAPNVPGSVQHATCPECKRRINVGSGGTDTPGEHPNMVAHQQGKECQAVQKAKRQGSLIGFFTRQDKSTPQTAAASPSIPSFVKSYTPPATAPIEAQCPLARMLLKKLQTAVSHLPQTVPEGSDDDAMAIFALAPEFLVDADVEDPWESLDPLLNQFCGYQASAEAVAARIRRGERGMVGFCRVLSYFTTEKGLSGSLIEGKVAVVLKALELL